MMNLGVFSQGMVVEQHLVQCFLPHLKLLFFLSTGKVLWNCFIDNCNALRYIVL